MLKSIRRAAVTLSRNMSYVPKDRLSGKVAVVTASTDGIGYAIARRLAKEGAKIVISSRKEKNVSEALCKLQSEGLTVTGRVCHVGKESDRKKLYEEAVNKFGGIDILISNAATNPAVGPVLECSEAAWDKTFEINVKASYLLAKEVLPFLRKRGGGKIVFVSSIGGLQPFNLLGTYSVTKTALIGLTKTAAQDLANENITVNAVAPGIIKTKFSATLHENESAAEQGLSQIPMGRFGESDDVAGVVAFLVSEDARYMTGETVVVAGGMRSRL